jgi:chemotaxis-related protein WspB
MLLLTLTAGANRYAIDVARVVEVIPRVELRTVPHAPVFVAGLLGYRGKVVPVLDLCLLLGVAASQDCLSTRIILVDDASGDHNRQNQGDNIVHDEIGESSLKQKPGPNLLGLVAEHVNDLAYVLPEQITPTPLILPDVPYLGAIVQTDQGIVQLIVVEQIRATVLQSSYSGRALVSDLNPGR